MVQIKSEPFALETGSKDRIAKLLVEAKNHQEFLKIYFDETKKIYPSFSYGQFAVRTALSKSLIKAMIDGKKRITPRSLNLLISGMQISKKVSNYFKLLVLLNEHSATEDFGSRLRIQKKLKKLALSTVEELSISDTDDAQLFSEFDLPFIYASLGSNLEGASTETVSLRTGFSAERVSLGLKILLKDKLVRHSGDRYVATKQFLFLANTKSSSFFYRFYLRILELQLETIKKNFESKEKLFHLTTFTIKQSDAGLAKAKLRELLNEFAQNVENPDGDLVVNLQTGFF